MVQSAPETSNDPWSEPGLAKIRPAQIQSMMFFASKTCGPPAQPGPEQPSQNKACEAQPNCTSARLVGHVIGHVAEQLVQALRHPGGRQPRGHEQEGAAGQTGQVGQVA